MPPAYIWRLAQREACALGKRKRRGHPEVGVGYVIADQPGPALQLGVEDSGVAAEVAERFFDHTRIGDLV